MTPGEKKVAVVAGVAAAAGLVILLLPKKADAKMLSGGGGGVDAPPPQFAAIDAYAVLDKAAKFETDIALLKDIRDKVLAASIADHRWDPYWTKIQQRLDFLSPLERMQYAAPAQGANSGTVSLKQMFAR